VLLVAFPISLLAGYGVRALVTAPPSDRSRRYTRRSGALVLVLAISAAIFFLGLIAQGWTSDSGFYWLLGSAVFVAIVAALGWGLLRWWVAAPRSEVPFFGLAAALIVFDLFTVGWRLNFSSDPPQAREQVPAAVAAIKADAGDASYRVFNEFRLDGNYGVQFGVEDIWGASPLRLARYEELMARLPWEESWPLLDVGYVVTWRQELPLPSEIIYQEEVGGETTYVHRLLTDYPRAWLVTEAEIVPEESVLERLSAADFDPQRMAVLQQAPPLPLNGSEPGLVQWQTRQPERLVLRVQAPSNSLLVLSEVSYPGWRAWVDGSPTPVLTADYVLRTVPIPAGEHLVELLFAPPLWAAGLALSLLSWLALGVGMVLLPRV